MVKFCEGNELFMKNPNKFVISLVVLAVIVGTGMYLSRKSARTSKLPGDTVRVAEAAPTNRPIVHAQRPADAPDTSEETDSSDASKLRPEKLEEYLRLHNRNAASLLAAFHSNPLGYMSYLYEAATNFPNDPRVQWTVLARDAFPEDRRKWLDSFKTSSPSNSLANYLSARDYFKNNQPDAAIKELLAASGKSQFSDYSMETILDGEDLGRFSGSSSMEMHVTSMGAMASDLLPELSNFKGVATGIRDAQQQYATSGDAASIQNLAQAGVGLADRLNGGDSGKFIINQLVGIASETIVLQALDQNASYDFLHGETPAERLAELKQQKTTIRDSMKTQSIVPTLNETEMTSYWERVKVYGEIPAMQWLAERNATAPNSGN
jgi:hypothetical protein